MIGKSCQKFVQMFIVCLTIISMLAQPAYRPTTVSAEGEPYPFFMISIRENWVHLLGFPASSDVAVSVLDAQGDPIYQTQVTADAQGQAWVDFGTEGRPALETGMTVRAEVASLSITKEMVLFSASIDSVDIQSRQISGHGPENSTGMLNMMRGSGVQPLEITTGVDGSWTLQVPPETSFLPGGQDLSVDFADVDGDVVQTKPVLPHLYVGLNIDFVYVSGYPIGETITFTITSGEEMILSRQYQTDENGTFGFSTREFSIKLEPGMVVTAAGQTYPEERSVTLHALSIDQIDPELNTASGSAEPGLNMIVNAYIDKLRYPFPLVADGEGNWQINFDSIDITEDHSVTVESYNQAEDSVFAVLPDPPVIQASLVKDWIEGYNFSSSSPVVISAYSGEESLFDPITRETDPWGSFHLNPDEIMMNLVPGNRISVQDPGMGITKELILEDLTLDNVDLDLDTLGGMAPASREVVATGGNQSDGREIKVTAGGDGHWTADFSLLPFDLTDDMNFNAKIFDGDGDFTLAELPPIPHIDARLDGNLVSGYDWPIGANLTLTVNDPQEGVFTDTQVNGTAPWSPGSGFVQFFLGEAFTIRPGQTVTISDGSVSRSTTVMDLQPPVVDALNSQIRGTANTGAVLWSQLCNQDGCAYRSVTVDVSGTYAIEFDEPGDEPGEEQTISLHPGDSGSINWADEFGNNTSRDWRVWDPVISANVQGRWVQGRDWPSGEVLTLTINGNVVGTATMAQAPWNPNDPNDIVAVFDDLSLAAGDELILSNADGSLAKTLVLSPLVITEINQAEDSISGTTTPGESLQVCVNIPDGCATRSVQADAQGNWTVDFTNPGQNEGDSGVADIVPGNNGWAASIDADRDQTQVDWNLANPYIIASVQKHWVQSRDWASGTTVSLKINGELIGTAVVEQAPWNPNDPNDVLAIFNLDPSITMGVGDTVTVSILDESITKTLTLVPLEVTDIDQLAAHISGITAPNGWVEVCINRPEGCMTRIIQADEAGVWITDFSQPGGNEKDSGETSQIEDGWDGWVVARDEDGDQVQIDWSISNPHIDAWLDSNSVSAYDWPIGATITLTISGPGIDGTFELSHSSEPGTGDPGRGFYQFFLGDAVTLSPGQTVSISDGNQTREMTVMDLQSPTVDLVDSSISGVTAPGAVIWSNLCNQDGCAYRSVVAGEDGSYEIDFDEQGDGSNEMDTIQIYPGNQAGLNWADVSGNNTSRNWRAWAPTLSANLDGRWVQGRDWPKGELLTLTVDGTVFGTAEMAQAPWNPDDPNDIVAIFNDVPLEAGSALVLSDPDGTRSKTLIVSTVEVTGINPLTDTVSGITAANATLDVCANTQDGCALRHLSADDQGNWSANFAVPGSQEDEQGTADIKQDSDGWVSIFDHDGDQTQVGWRLRIPRIFANVQQHWIQSRDWALGTHLNLRIDGQLVSTAVVAQAPWNPDDPNDILGIFELDPSVALNLGNVLTVSNQEETIEKSLTLVPLEVTQIDPQAATVSGHTAANAWVEVCINTDEGCLMRNIQADQNGDWMVDYSVAGQDPRDNGVLASIALGANGWAGVNDEDNDQVLIDWSYQNPFMDIWIDSNTISAYHWPVGANLSLSIHAGETEVYQEAVVNGADPQDPSKGFYQFILPEENPLEPGQTVTITDQSIERVGTVQSLDAPVVDVIHSQIHGTAPVGAYIWTCLFSDEGCVYRSTVVGESGTYSFDFGVQGPNEGEEATRILEPGDAGGLNLEDEQGNHISRIWNAPNYPLHVNVMDQQVHGWDWRAGSEVTLTLDDPQTETHAEVTRTVEDVPGACGVPCFEMSEIPWTLAPGQTVTLSDGLVMKTVTVSPLQITEIDIVNDHIHGIATPGSTVSVNIFSEEDKHRLTQADDAGNWTVDFSQPGETEGEQTTIDLVMSDFGRAIQLNPGKPNDDGTQQYWSAFPVRLDTDQFEENASAGSLVASFVSLNPSVDLNLSYSLVDGDGSDDNSKFTVDGVGLHIIDSPNFEQQQTYNVRLRMTNAGDAAEWAEINYQLHVIDINEAPYQLALDQAAVDENVAGGTLVGHFLASDPDQNQNIHFSLVSGEGDTDNEFFEVDSDHLNILVSPDYESKPFYQILVRVTDDGTPNLYAEESFTILINNINEGGLEIVLAPASVNENVANGSTVGNLTVTDPDGAGNYGFSLVSGAEGTDNPSFTITGNVLSINQSPDYETKNTYAIRVQATDLDKPENTLIQTLAVTIHDVNEAPSALHISTTSMDENIPAGSTAAELSTDDPDEGQTHSYSLVQGEGDGDNSAFEISGNHLVIKASPNFETKSTYHILVRTLENGENALGIDQAFTLTVNDLNETPTNIILSAASVNENVAGDTAVGSLTASDPDSSQSHSFTLVNGSGDTDNSAFTVSGNELRIEVSPDFEAKPSYSIRVQVTDNGSPSLSFVKIFTITVNDLNEAPSALSLSSTHVNENVAAGITTGVFTASDPDQPAQTLSFALVAGEGATDNAAFTVTGNALIINASPDYETKSSYSIRVQVTDNGEPALSSVQIFTISLNDLNERPANLALSNAAIAENAPTESRGIGTFSADDPDQPVQTLTYSLVTGDGSTDNLAFTLTGNALSVKGAPDYETKPTYTIRVRVTDNGTPNLYSESAFTIAVTNVVEPPLVASFNKTGLQGTPINFTLNDFPDHFISIEASGTGALEKIKITSLPEHGSLQLNQSAVALNDEIPAGNLNQLRYVPGANYSGSDIFSWMGANSSGYSTGTGQVFITVGLVTRYGMQVNPAGDAKSVKAGSNAVYTLEISNTGNVSDTFTIGKEGSPRWTTTSTPAQSITLAPNGKATLTVSVAVPSGASGSDEAVLKITSQGDSGKTSLIRLKTTAVSAPVAPIPVLLSVLPSSVNISSLGTATLVLTGSNFTDPMTVRIGGVASPSVSRTNSGELVVRTPAGLQVGKKDIQVCNASAKCVTLPDALTILDNAPLIEGVYPNQGYNDTQNAILIQGYNLSAMTVFTLVDAALDKQPTGVSVSNSQVRAVIPAGLPAGTYNLQACNQEKCMILPGAYTALDVIKNDFSASNEDLWTAPTTIREGNTILLGLNVHRSSGAGAAAVDVAFYLDDPTVPANKISPALNPSTSLMTPGSVEAVTAAWKPIGLTGTVRIYAVIDPDGLVTEASRANNIVSMTIQILPRQEKDETAPIINALTINGGADTTHQNQVSIGLLAADNPGGVGIQTMNVVERVFNTSARQWVVAQETGWIVYQPNFQMNLSDQGGLHYVQVWIADKAGNTSAMAQTSINYEPAQDVIMEGQVRVYRVDLTAGQVKHIVLETLTGDADVYVWDPDGNLVGSSITSGNIDRVDFTALLDGMYQVEVYGYVDSTYAIDFNASAPELTMNEKLPDLGAADKTPRTQPTISPQNEPLMNIPTSLAPITADPDQTYLFMPIIKR